MMTKIIAALILLLAACRPGPGEVRCATNFGVTKCRDNGGWWCSEGRCHEDVGECERKRTRASETCENQPTAVCSDETGCFATAGECGDAERDRGEDGEECEVK